MDETTCGSCRFWEFENSNNAGEYGGCYRYPPSLPPHKAGSVNTFPVTFEGDWCGEWQQKPPEQATTSGASSILISEMGFTIRTWRCLCDPFRGSPEIITAGGLAEYSPSELLCRKGFGPASLKEVRTKLRELGLSLRDDPEATP